MRSPLRAAAVLAFGTFLGGCAASTTTSKVAVDYNRIFAKSRDEVLVTNILRASAREPLHFSTMGAVQGGVRNSGTITLGLTNLLGGGDAAEFGPTVAINDGINPTVNINPLDNKDFAEGILKPVSLEVVNYFVAEGWDPEFLLTALVGGIVCANGDVIPNRGVPWEDAPQPHYRDFVDMFSAAEGRPIVVSTEKAIAKMRMPTKDAATLMKEGVGAGRKLKAEPVLDRQGNLTDKVDVTITDDPQLKLANLQTDRICGERERARPLAATLNNPSLSAIEGRSSKIMLRSVESLIYFLGETHRSRRPAGTCSGPDDVDPWPYYVRKRPYAAAPEKLSLFRLERSCSGGAMPTPTFLRTQFNDSGYYILRAPEAPGQRYVCGNEFSRYCDRTLSTLSFLSALIALQTNPSSITSATPVVNVGSK